MIAKIVTEGEHVDITMTDTLQLEVSIRNDGKVLWINTQHGCLVRVCGIKGGIQVIDGRAGTRRRNTSPTTRKMPF